LFLGLGISPLGPRILATLASLGIIAGSAIRMSKSIFPSEISVISFSSAISIFCFLPVPWGRETDVESFSLATIWTSTDSSKELSLFFSIN